MRFEFSSPTRIIFGNGAVKEVGLIAQQSGKKALLVSGPVKIGDEIIGALLEKNRVSFVPYFVDKEPSIDVIEKGVQLAKENDCDFVIGIGGGSVMDAGKAISAMLSNPGSLMDYLEVVGQNLPLVNQARPMIAIPTTAGTGTEVTRNAVLRVHDKRIKVSLRSPLIVPNTALVDPELTHSLPPHITAWTGLDALTQVIEPYVSLKASLMTDLLSREGIMRISRSIHKAFQNGNDREAREDMAWGSLLGGISLVNAGLGAVHGFAAAIGGMFVAPHGAICARLLPIVVKANINALIKRDPNSGVLTRYREIGQIIAHSQTARTEDTGKILEDMIGAFDIPRLSTFGITLADIPTIVGLTSIASSTKSNPIKLEEGELADILSEAF